MSYPASAYDVAHLLGSRTFGVATTGAQLTRQQRQTLEQWGGSAFVGQLETPVTTFAVLPVRVGKRYALLWLDSKNGGIPRYAPNRAITIGT